MGKQKFDVVMSEMENIVRKVKLFPSHVQRDVFSALLKALLNEHDVRKNGHTAEVRTPDRSGAESLPNVVQSSDWIALAEIGRLVNEFDLKDITAVQFAALVAYVHTVLAPDPAKRDAINISEFEEACVEVGREIGNSKSALDNAKKGDYKYLQGGKRYGYTLTNQGKIFVKTKLLQAES